MGALLVKLINAANGRTADQHTVPTSLATPRDRVSPCVYTVTTFLIDMGVVMLSCSPVSLCWATTEQDFSQSYEIGRQGVKHIETYRLPENNSRERPGFLNTLAEHIAELGCDRQS